MASERIEATRLLRRVETSRARAAAAVPRGHAALQLGHAVMMSAYLAVFVYAGSSAVDLPATGTGMMTLLLPPVPLSAGLMSGANQRFGGRLQQTARGRLAMAVFVILLLVLGTWTISGGEYPWWLSPASALLTLMLFGVRPARMLMRRDAPTAQGQPVALSRPARLTTLLIGGYLGAACAVVMYPVAAWAVMMFGMIGAALALSARSSRAGLAHVGYAWSSAQWLGFATATLVMFSLALLCVGTDAVTPPIAIGAGLLVAALIAVSVLLPGRTDGASAA